MAEDDDFARLHDAVDEALEEMDWLGGEFDLMDMMSDDTDDIEDDDWVVEE